MIFQIEKLSTAQILLFMKPSNRLLVLVMACWSTCAYSQIPNSGFEFWNALGNCEEVVEWNSTNIFDTAASFCPISRSTDHYPAAIGNYSIRLENNPAFLPSFTAIGVVSTTQLDGSDRPLFPISGHPNSLCGYYKFNSVNGDTMSMNVFLYYNSIELASGRFMSSGSVANWTPFNIPISSYAMADSARITIMAANIEGAGVQGNSVLYIDNLSFDTLIVDRINDLRADDSFQLFPNPALDWVSLSLKENRSGLIRVEITDLSGRSLHFWNFSSFDQAISFNCSDLENGLYLLRLTTTPSKEVVKKLLIAR